MLRRIKTQEEIDKKQKQNKIVIGLVLVFLMVLSTVGYSIMSTDEQPTSKVSENGRDFYRGNGIWTTEVEGQTYNFRYLPSELSDISIQGEYDLGVYSGKPINFVGENEGVLEIWNSLGRHALRYQPACLESLPCEGDLPKKNCSSDLIIFKEGNETLVYKEENCVFITGDYVKGADAFLYKVLKIN